MALPRPLVGAALAILAWITLVSDAEACAIYNFSFKLERLEKVPIVFRGRPISTHSGGVVRTFAVEHTYRGPIRKEWTVVGPQSRKWARAGHVFGEPHFDSEPKSSSYIVGITKLEGRHLERIKQRLASKGIRAEYIALGGLCGQPVYFAVTKSLGTRLALATRQLGSKEDSERERLLRKYFGFYVGQDGLEHAVAAATSRSKSLFRRYGRAFDEAGVVNALSVRILVALKGNKGRMDHESRAQARKNPNLWLQKLDSGPRKQLTQYHREFMWLLNTFDKNGDLTVDHDELASAVAEAFSFYDKNSNGIADDFDGN